MPVLENAGNTSIESNATENSTLFITTGNKTTRLQDLYYAQSKSQGSGWIPIGAETSNNVTTVVIKHTYQDPPNYGPYYQAIDFDPISGAQVGIHAFGDSYFTREQQIRLNAAGRSQEIIDTAYFGDQTEGEFLQRFDWVINPSSQGSTSTNAAFTISAPSSYGKNSADLITNYNPKTDQPIQIDLSSFEGATGKLKIAKKSNKVAQLAKKNINFIYDRQQGYLYYNENGKQPGLGDGDIVAILEGKPKAGMGNFAFI